MIKDNDCNHIRFSGYPINFIVLNKTLEIRSVMDELNKKWLV